MLSTATEDHHQQQRQERQEHQQWQERQERQEHRQQHRPHLSTAWPRPRRMAPAPTSNT